MQEKGTLENGPDLGALIIALGLLLRMLDRVTRRAL